MLKRLGSTETKAERYNNGYAHYSMAGPSSFMRAFERRQHFQVAKVELIVKKAVKVKDDDSDADPEKLVGRIVTINKPLFYDSMTGTKWIENFYQESPSINARARDDQVQIGVEAFKQPAFSTWMTAEQDKAPEVDK
jgi:hypothetical protein